MTDLPYRALLAFIAASVLSGASAGAHAASVVGTGEGSFSNLSSCDNSGSHQDCRIVSTSNGSDTQVQWGSQSSSFVARRRKQQVAAVCDSNATLDAPAETLRGLAERGRI